MSKERNKCHQCGKKFLGTNWQEIHITIGDKKRILCSLCWDKEKESLKDKVKQDEIDICLYENSDDGKGMWSYTTPKILEVCLICDNWFNPNLNYYDDKRFRKICSSKCREKYNNLSSQEKSNLDLNNQIKSNQIKSNQIKSNQIKSNQTSTADSIEQDAKQTNYLPWILGGVGVLAGIGILFYFLTRKKGGEE